MELSLAAFVLGMLAAVAAAPSLTQGDLPQESIAAQTAAADQQRYYREKRSSYGAPIYAAPPCASSYLAPVHHAAYSPHYGYPSYGIHGIHGIHGVHGIHGIPALPQYREAEEETMSFSDVEHEDAMDPSAMMSEHVPFARYAYGSPAVPVSPHYGAAVAGISPASAAIGGLSPAGQGPAIGVFPNANAGGCAVPLLLSCSPSIRSGHIIQSQPHYVPGNAYRGVDDPHAAHETHEETHEELAHETNSHLPLHQ